MNILRNKRRILRRIGAIGTIIGFLVCQYLPPKTEWLRKAEIIGFSACFLLLVATNEKFT